MTKPKRLTSFLLLLLATMLMLNVPAPVSAEDDPAKDKPAEPAAKPDEKPAVAPPDKKAMAGIIEAAVEYFDLGADLWKVRQALLKALEPEVKRGYQILGDMEALRDLVYKSRYFEPQVTDKKWRNAQEVREFDNKGSLYAVKSDDLSMSFRLPKKYPKKNKKFDKQPRIPPVPLLVSTVERKDVTLEKRPGWKLLGRRYPKNDGWDEIRDTWALFVPIAPGAVYIHETKGTIRREYFNWQFVEFIRHYHVDFDRIVLDGMQEVLLTATTAPMIYAGFVLRGGKLDEKLANTVVNFAHVPVFVTTGNEELAESLKKAGHKNVTVGNPDEQLPAWLKERKRVMPRKFEWRLDGAQHQFAHWINMEKIITAEAAKREVTVDVDVPSRTINIDAYGVTELSVFLNDDILPLDGKVKILINGNLEYHAEVERTVDLAFSEDPFQLRESMYFGLLFPARVANLTVRKHVKKAEPKEPVTPTATPEQEAEAKKYFDLVQPAIDKGLLDRAKKLLEKVVSIGHTSYKVKAQEWLQKLG